MKAFPGALLRRLCALSLLVLALGYLTHAAWPSVSKSNLGGLALVSAEAADGSETPGCVAGCHFFCHHGCPVPPLPQAPQILVVQPESVVSQEMVPSLRIRHFQPLKAPPRSKLA
ncbi:MAG: hypothetical protein LWX11_07565 [Firmicutes bacterium]|nr:hypothetical protein [Bacillota bacterium]